MTLIQMIQQTGIVPHKAEFPDGQKLELQLIRTKKGIRANYWLIQGEIHDRIIFFGDGEDAEAAKEQLKIKILKS